LEIFRELFNTGIELWRYYVYNKSMIRNNNNKGNTMLLTEQVSITVTDSNGKKYNRVADIVTDGCTDNVQHEVSKLINKEWAKFCKAHGEISYTWNYK